jgi:hypothetical protein
VTFWTSSERGRRKNRKFRIETRRPSLWTSRNSRRLRMRLCRGKRCREIIAGLTAELFLRDGYRQLLPTLAAAAADDFPARGSLHALTESVRAQSAFSMGLKRPLHSLPPVLAAAGKRTPPCQKTGGLDTTRTQLMSIEPARVKMGRLDRSGCFTPAPKKMLVPIDEVRPWRWSAPVRSVPVCARNSRSRFAWILFVAGFSHIRSQRVVSPRREGGTMLAVGSRQAACDAALRDREPALPRFPRAAGNRARQRS